MIRRSLAIAALALIPVAATWAVTVWLAGTTSLGLTISTGDPLLFRVGHVVPDSRAWAAGVVPGSIVTSLELDDGTTIVSGGRPTGVVTSGELISSTRYERRIDEITVLSGPTGELDPSAGQITIVRAKLTEDLRASGWYLLAGGILAAAVAALALSGRLGNLWRDAALPAAAAVLAATVAMPLRAAGGTLELMGAFVVPAVATAVLVSAILGTINAGVSRRALGAAGAILVVLPIVWTVARIVGDASYVDTTGFRYGLLAAALVLPAGLAALVPGGGVERLDRLTLALIASAALLVPIFGPAGLLTLGASTIALAVWRGLTIHPLMRAAEATRRELDLAVAAAEAERARLAADLHDDALQDLTQIVRRFDDAGDHAGARLARDVATRIRAICSDLRLPMLDSLGAGPALEWLVERARLVSNGDVSLRRADVGRPPAEVELAVFRVAQEAIANAVRHATAPIEVSYEANDSRVHLTIVDAGPGLPTTARGGFSVDGQFGLVAMRQRAEHIGAALDVGPSPQGGTRVTLEWAHSART